MALPTSLWLATSRRTRRLSPARSPSPTRRRRPSVAARGSRLSWRFQRRNMRPRSPSMTTRVGSRTSMTAPARSATSRSRPLLLRLGVGPEHRQRPLQRGCLRLPGAPPEFGRRVQPQHLRARRVRDDRRHDAHRSRQRPQGLGQVQDLGAGRRGGISRLVFRRPCMEREPPDPAAPARPDAFFNWQAVRVPAGASYHYCFYVQGPSCREGANAVVLTVNRRHTRVAWSAGHGWASGPSPPDAHTRPPPKR